MSLHAPLSHVHTNIRPINVCPLPSSLLTPKKRAGLIEPSISVHVHVDAAWNALENSVARKVYGRERCDGADEYSVPRHDDQSKAPS